MNVNYLPSCEKVWPINCLVRLLREQIFFFLFIDIHIYSNLHLKRKNVVLQTLMAKWIQEQKTAKSFTAIIWGLFKQVKDAGHDIIFSKRKLNFFPCTQTFVLLCTTNLIYEATIQGTWSNWPRIIAFNTLSLENTEPFHVLSRF